MARLSVRILGCGSSGGVPRLGGHWGACDPQNPRNRRQRCSLLVTRETDRGATRVLIDTTPDMRAQLLEAGTGTLDAVLYTHAHADHVHGLDDLRQIVFNTRKRLPVWADGDTGNSLLSRFGYAFVQPHGSPYPPILDLNTIEGPVTVRGAGGPISFEPVEVDHGSTSALGFRFDDIAYLPDVATIPEASWPRFLGLRLWILDALRRDPHPTHAHLARSLEWIEAARPERAILTNMHVDLDYAEIDAETPANVTPAHDGLTLSFEV